MVRACKLCVEGIKQVSDSRDIIDEVSSKLWNLAPEATQPLPAEQKNIAESARLCQVAADAVSASVHSAEEARLAAEQAATAAQEGHAAQRRASRELRDHLGATEGQAKQVEAKAREEQEMALQAYIALATRLQSMSSHQPSLAQPTNLQEAYRQCEQLLVSLEDRCKRLPQLRSQAATHGLS